MVYWELTVHAQIIETYMKEKQKKPCDLQEFIMQINKKEEFLTHFTVHVKIKEELLSTKKELGN